MINRRLFLGGFAVMVAATAAPASLATPLLSSKPNVVGWALHDEVWVLNPNDFGWLYRAIFAVNGRHVAATCSISDEGYLMLDVRERVRQEARDAATAYAKREAAITINVGEATCVATR